MKTQVHGVVKIICQSPLYRTTRSKWLSLKSIISKYTFINFHVYKKIHILSEEGWILNGRSHFYRQTDREIDNGGTKMRKRLKVNPFVPRIQNAVRRLWNFIYRVKRTEEHIWNLIILDSVVPETSLTANRAAECQSHRIFSLFIKRFLLFCLFVLV